MPDPNAGATGWIVASILTVLGLVGGLIAWLIGRGDRVDERKERYREIREAKLGAWHRELLAREELFIAQQGAFQARIDRHLAGQDEKISDLERENEKYRISTSALFARMMHHAPDDPVLGQVTQLLGSAFPLSPSDFDGSLDELRKRLR